MKHGKIGYIHYFIEKGSVFMSIYFIDGHYTSQDEIKISIDDRGYYFGDGVYEVVKVYDGQLFTGVEHFERLLRSAEKISMNVPYTVDDLIEISNKLIADNGLENGHVYLQVTRGVSKRQHNFPTPAVPAFMTAYTVEANVPNADQAAGVKVKTVEDVRWLRCDIKSLNLLGSVLAKEEAKLAGCAEAMLHRDGVVTEGSSTNMFAIKDGVIYTHPATNLILEGITRQVVLQVCEELDIPVKLEAFKVEDVFTMDELFYTSTTVEVMPIIEVDGKMIGNGQKGPITDKIQAMFKTKTPHNDKQLS